MATQERKGRPDASASIEGTIDRTHPPLFPEAENQFLSKQTSLSVFFDHIPLPMGVFSPEGQVVYLNSAWRTLLGLNEDLCHRLTAVQLVHHLDRYLILAQFRALSGGDTGQAIECRLSDAASGVRWHRLSWQPLQSSGLEQGHWLCVGTDIDELKRKQFDLQRQAAMQTDMLNISVDCIKLIAPDGTLMHMNKAGCRALGVSEESGFGMPWLPLLPEDVWNEGERALDVARAGAFARFPGRSVLPGQPPQHWDNMLTPIIASSGQPSAILCVSREVTAEREAQALVKESQERLSMAAQVGGLGIWDYDIQNDDLQCDETWYRIMGRDPTHPIRTIAEFRPFIHPDDVDRATEVNQTMTDLIAENRDYTIAFRIIRPNGDIRWIRSAASLIQDERQVAVRAVGFVVDVTDAWRGELALRDANRALEEEKLSLAQQVLEDPLTGLSNRRHLDSELARICLRAQETGLPICLGMIDIDYFKGYNDRYGHLGGDHALKQVAHTLRSVTRRSDFVARYGGEEFTFVLTDVEDPFVFLNRLYSDLERLHIPHDASPLGRITISCGCIVTRNATDRNPVQLFKEGDELLYQAKLEGRNRYVVKFI